MLKAFQAWKNRQTDPNSTNSAAKMFALVSSARTKIAALPWKKWVMLGWIPSFVEGFVDLVLKLGTLLLVCFFLVFFVRLFKDQGYVIQSFSVPKILEEQGYSGAVVAQRIQDQFTDLKIQAGSVKADSLQLKGNEEDIDLAVLGVGLSLRTLALQIRETLGRENNTLRGELTRIGNRYEIQIRMTGYDKITKTVWVKEENEAAALDTLFRKVAEGILYQTDPYRLSLVLRKEERYDEAIKIIRHVLKLDTGEDHWAYLGWGSMLNELNDPEGAIEKYEKAIEIKPDFSLPYANVAWIYNNLGRIDDAVFAFEKAIELEPDNVWRRNSLAWIFYRNGMPEKADSLYEHLFNTMNLEPTLQTEVATSWAEMKMQDDNVPEAKRIIDSYVEAYSENALSYLIRGVSAFGEQDTVRAVAYMKDAFELDPGDQAAISANIGFSQNIGRFDHTIKVYRNADWSNVGKWNKVNAYNQVAMAFNSLGQHDSAYALVHRAIDLAPEMAYPYTTLAETFFYQELRDSCFFYMEKALKMGFDTDDFSENDPPYDQLYQLPEFQRLLKVYGKEKGLKN